MPPLPTATDLTSHATSTTDFYALLSLTPSFASQRALDRAWRLTALKYHPDKVSPSDTTSLEKFHLAQIGYDILSDPNLKSIYDNARSAREQKERRKEALEGKRKVMIEELEGRERKGKAKEGGVRTDEGEEERRVRLLGEEGKRRRLEKDERLRKEEEEERRQEQEKVQRQERPTQNVGKENGIGSDKTDSRFSSPSLKNGFVGNCSEQEPWPQSDTYTHSPRLQALWESTSKKMKMREAEKRRQRAHLSTRQGEIQV